MQSDKLISLPGRPWIRHSSSRPSELVSRVASFGYRQQSEHSALCKSGRKDRSGKAARLRQKERFRMKLNLRFEFLRVLDKYRNQIALARLISKHPDRLSHLISLNGNENVARTRSEVFHCRFPFSSIGTGNDFHHQWKSLGVTRHELDAQCEMCDRAHWCSQTFGAVDCACGSDVSSSVFTGFGLSAGCFEQFMLREQWSIKPRVLARDYSSVFQNFTYRLSLNSTPRILRFVVAYVHRKTVVAESRLGITYSNPVRVKCSNACNLLGMKVCQKCLRFFSMLGRLASDLELQKVIIRNFLKILLFGFRNVDCCSISQSIRSKIKRFPAKSPVLRSQHAVKLDRPSSKLDKTSIELDYSSLDNLLLQMRVLTSLKKSPPGAVADDQRKIQDHCSNSDRAKLRSRRVCSRTGVSPLLSGTKSTANTGRHNPIVKLTTPLM